MISRETIEAHLQAGMLGGGGDKSRWSTTTTIAFSVLLQPACRLLGAFPGAVDRVERIWVKN